MDLINNRDSKIAVNHNKRDVFTIIVLRSIPSKLVALKF